MSITYWTRRPGSPSTATPPSLPIWESTFLYVVIVAQFVTRFTTVPLVSSRDTYSVKCRRGRIK
jgi:hypothetical protein